MFKSKETKEAEKQAADAARRAVFEARNRAAFEAEAQREQREQVADEKLKRDRDKFVQDFATNVAATVEAVGSATLFTDIYIPVDAQMNQFESASGIDLRDLNEFGSSGWQLVSVVPRTYGGLQSYQVSKTTAYGVSGWGKDEHKVGLGGHVIGIYAVMALHITAKNLKELKDDIREIAEASFPDHLLEKQQPTPTTFSKSSNQHGGDTRLTQRVIK